MNHREKKLLAQVFSEPDRVTSLDLPGWSLLISQARRANVLARLGFILINKKLSDKLPNKPKLHIISQQVFVARFEASLQKELVYVQNALVEINVPLVLLKGSAYFVMGSDASIGRTFSDVDILVAENQLPLVEPALIKAGWMTTTLDPYDQKYYRQWMHEIPPMRNLRRQTTIDVHHNILPKTTKSCPDANLLLANIEQVPDTDYWVLAPEDRVLHSAAHLFYGGEWDNGFRDLSDLDLLLREFSVEQDFWGKLLKRAVMLRQEAPLYYSLRYTSKILKTPIPKEVMEASLAYAPGMVRRNMMDFLFMNALLPNHPSCNDINRQLACFLLHIRSHWLRMPVHLLVPHLARKAWRQLFSG